MQPQLRYPINRKILSVLFIHIIQYSRYLLERRLQSIEILIHKDDLQGMQAVLSESQTLIEHDGVEKHRQKRKTKEKFPN